MERRSILSIVGGLGAAAISGDREQQTFGCWAVVELFGHARYAGYVQEGEIGGQGFIRLDVPKTSKREAWSKVIGLAAVYSITPVEESYARRCAEALQAEPVTVYLPEFGKPIPRQYLLDEPDGDDDDREAIPF